MQQAYESGHSIGNHTATHLRFVGGTSWSAAETGNHPNNLTIRKTEDEIYDDMAQVRDAMENIGIPKEHQFGFRTPFLAYSDSAYRAMYRIGFLYDCSINSIHAPGEANFPYTLDVIPGQQEPRKTNPIGNIPPDNVNWWGQGQGKAANSNPIREHPGLWVIPASAIEIAEVDREDLLNADYGLDNKGNPIPYPGYIVSSGWRVAGLDYNIWMEAKLDSGQSVRALMNTVEKTLAGNRAPIHLGFHSQYYFTPSDMPLDPMSLARRRGMFEKFVEQASELPDVFFVTGDMVIAWMENPCEAADFDPANYHRAAVVPEGGVSPVSIKNSKKTATQSAAFTGIHNGQINLQLTAGNYSVELYNLKGRLIRKAEINAKNGVNATGLKTDKLSKGVFVLNVKQAGTSVLSQKITIK